MSGYGWRKSSFSSINDCVEIGWRKSTYSASDNCVEVGWRKSSFSGTNQCIELVVRGEVRIRNSQHPDRGALRFTPGAVAAWIRGIREGEFDG